MKQVASYQISKESYARMLKAQRYNPALEIQFQDRTGSHTHTLSAGYDDELYVYRESGETYALSLNTRLGYAGLQIFNGSMEIGGIFFQEGQLDEAIGSLDLPPQTIIRQLREYIIP